MNGYYDEMVNFLGKIFSAALKTNDALEKGILTGCLRIAKESTPKAGFSLFTGLNNFNVYSIYDDQSCSSFGFTPEETMKLLKDFNAKTYEFTVKEW
ncbi:AAA family ATPase [Erysipelotrichaceae bacterium 66202529]|nr:AAA family ATPase [Erysipelotrichaceae bacterium 66202529]